jgi:hypothetical protein
MAVMSSSSQVPRAFGAPGERVAGQAAVLQSARRDRHPSPA